MQPGAELSQRQRGAWQTIPGELKLLFFWFLNPRQVLRNLSLLKILKSSNHRILELHNLAKRCWNSLLSVPKILHIASR